MLSISFSKTQPHHLLAGSFCTGVFMHEASGLNGKNYCDFHKQVVNFHLVLLMMPVQCGLLKLSLVQLPLREEVQVVGLTKQRAMLCTGHMLGESCHPSNLPASAVPYSLGPFSLRTNDLDASSPRNKPASQPRQGLSRARSLETLWSCH